MLPSTYLFDPDGKPAARKIGLITRAEIEAFIRRPLDDMNLAIPSEPWNKSSGGARH
ncbi:MAG: hypothetical protein P0107_02930 [Nitrosomonas sp.]|nr:hypothetical protein [Nitrosomonas sp.]